MIPDPTQTWHGIPVWVHEHTRSTMDLGHELAQQGGSGIIIAKEQSAGRGVGDHVWVSERGGLYLTWVFEYRPHLDPVLYARDAFVLAMITALGHHGVPDAAIKEPNDIIVGHRKIGGVLEEIMPYGLIIGIGVNANNPTAAIGLAAISVQEITGTAVDLDRLAADFIAAFNDLRAGYPANLSRLRVRWRNLVAA